MWEVARVGMEARRRMMGMVVRRIFICCSVRVVGPDMYE